MICTTIQNRNLEQILRALEQCEMAEIRLDRCDLSLKDIEECFSSDVPLIATCRLSELMANEPSLQDAALSQQSREIKAAQIAERRLCRAIEAGARYVDVEIEAPKVMSKRVRNVAHENGTVFIRSFHDFDGTGSLESLQAMVVKCHYHGADMVKVVTMAHSQEDVDRVMSLYGWCGQMAGTDMESLAEGGLVAFCMGDAGSESRLDCLRHGAPFTYAALDEDAQAVGISGTSMSGPAAPGQRSASEMASKVYGDFRFITCEGGQQEPLAMPCSKSFAQRAIVAAALAEGESHLRGYTPCGDNDAAIQVARALGAEVHQDGSTLTIKGISASPGSWRSLAENSSLQLKQEDGSEQKIESLHVGESGLLARIMIPVMAQLSNVPVRFTGEKTLLDRPLSGAHEMLGAFGARLWSDTEDAALQTAPDKGPIGDFSVKVPLTVSGPLKSGRTDVTGKHGSQLISGFLMALPFAEKNSTLVVSDPKSIPYMFITLEVLKKFGIRTGNEMLGGRDFLESDGDWSLCTEIVFKIKGGQKYRAADIDLEGDWSAAANFLVAGAIFGRVEVEGLDTTSLQADLSIMDVLMDAGASLSQLDGEKGTIAVQRAPLRAFSLDASNCPDLFPILAVLAAFCQGTSRIAGVGRLANKESDRGRAILEMLAKMGVKAVIEADELIVEGHTLARRLLDSGVGLLKGGEYSSHHDHRMVMALKVAALGADSPVVIDDETCVEKSFPSFLEVFPLARHKK